MNGPPNNNFPLDWAFHQQPGGGQALPANLTNTQQQLTQQYTQRVNGNNPGSFMNSNTVNNNNTLNMTVAGDVDPNVLSEETKRVLDWIAQLLHRDTRETALLELSKKREQVPDLALLLWYSYGKLFLSYS